MKQKILIAVDGSEASVKAIESAGIILSGCADFELVLFHVLEPPSMLLVSEPPGLVLQEAREEWVEENRGVIQEEIFDPAVEILKGKGVNENMTTIRTKICTKGPPDVALAIIAEAKANAYDIVVLGKRGLSRTKEFILGSVSCKVVHHLDGCTIWIVE